MLDRKTISVSDVLADISSAIEKFYKMPSFLRRHSMKCMLENCAIYYHLDLRPRKTRLQKPETSKTETLKTQTVRPYYKCTKRKHKGSILTVVLLCEGLLLLFLCILDLCF